MTLINGQQITFFKAVVSLIFCTLFLSACKNENQTNAGLCNGGWGLVGGYYCDILPGGGGDFLCVFLGKDNDRDGAYRSGTSDQCIIDDYGDIDCDRMCSLNNNCSKVTCMSQEQVDEFKRRTNVKGRQPDSEPLKSR